MRKEILKFARKGKGLPIGYHCNSFGEDQIELTVTFYNDLFTKKEKKDFERIINEFLGSKDKNLVWVTYVVSEVLGFSSSKKLINNLIRNNKINNNDIRVCSLIVKEMRGDFKLLIKRKEL